MEPARCARRGITSLNVCRDPLLRNLQVGAPREMVSGPCLPVEPPTCGLRTVPRLTTFLEIQRDRPPGTFGRRGAGEGRRCRLFIAEACRLAPRVPSIGVMNRGKPRRSSPGEGKIEQPLPIETDDLAV